MSSSLEVTPLAGPPDVELEVPGSKSHTNRALVCAALAGGRSRLGRVLFADDTEAMLGALARLGVGVEIDRAAATAEIEGPLRPPPTDGRPLSVDVRQSGTTGRFLLPLLAATPGRFVLDGDPQLRKRPFGPQLHALGLLGAGIDGSSLPLHIEGRILAGRAIEVSADISSQFLSGLLLTAPLLTGTTVLTVPGEMVSRPYVELTVATMASFGVDVAVDNTAGADITAGVDNTAGIGEEQPEVTGRPASRFTVENCDYRATDLQLEPDASAASYFFAAAAITGGRVRVRGLGRDTIQGDLRFVDVLARMGATVRRGRDWTEVTGGGALTGIRVDMADISDTVQTLAVVATFADSPTEIGGVGFIRHKETDRIGAVVAELAGLGIEVEETAGGMIVHPGTPRPGRVRTYDDHRMAMSFALFGLSHAGIEIDNPGCVSKTFPRFFDVLDQLR